MKKLYCVWYSVGNGFSECIEFLEGDDATKDEAIGILENDTSSYLVVYEKYDIVYHAWGMFNQAFGADVKVSSEDDKDYMYKNLGLTYYHAEHMTYGRKAALRVLGA